MRRECGLKDEPVLTKDQDSLGLERYAETLSAFVLRCDTPMTIALQGDWGSGKTSLMNLVKARVERSRSVRHTIWFNTWQYSQLNLGDNLAFSFLSEFVSEWPTREGEKGIEPVLHLLSRLGRAAAVTAGAALGHGGAVKEGLDALGEERKGLDQTNPAKALRDLKDRLQRIVEGGTDSASQGRVVIFIDDLDRLVPAKAVELLEVMKIFVDLRGCVFVLACDYEVVVEGLTQKLGAAARAKGRSFFDKIIQVPFNMPVHRYRVDDYFRRHLEAIDPRLGAAKTDIRLYGRLVEHSIGFNPRAIKRVLNCLLLLKDVLRDDVPPDCKYDEWARILFGSLCMQNAYPGIFSYLCRVPITQEVLERLRDERLMDEDPALADALREGELQARPADRRRLGLFVGAFCEAIQLRTDADAGSLSERELEALSAALKSSAVTSTLTQADASYEKEDFLRNCRGDEESYFHRFFVFLEEAGIGYKMGTVGFSVADREGRSIGKFFPTSARRSIEISLKNVPESRRGFLHGFFPSDREKIERGETISAKPGDFPVEKLCEVIAGLRQ